MMNHIDLSTWPPEILGLVFEHLSSKDRRKVRLVCRCFYQSCNQPRFLKDETIRVVGNQNIASIFEFLSKSYRSLWNLKFDSLLIISYTPSILSFFVYHGSNIRSLHFHDCKFCPRLLASIIIFCKALEEVSITFSEQNRDYQILFDDFIFLEMIPLVRENVSVFTLEMRCGVWLTNRKILRFLTIFPNIKKFNLTVHNLWLAFNELSSDPADIMSDTKFSYSSVNSLILSIGERLQKLKLHFPCFFPSPDCLFYTFAAISSWKDLTDISVEWNNLRHENIMDLFRGFRHLTSIQIVITMHRCPPINSDPFLRILENNSELRFLKISISAPINIDYKFFRALVVSKLVSLDTRHTTFLSVPEFEIDESLSPNYALKDLIMQLSHDKNDCLTHFSTYFRALEHLEVYCRTTRDLVQLQNIFEYQLSNSFASLSVYEDGNEGEMLLHRARQLGKIMAGNGQQGQQRPEVAANINPA